MLADDTFCAIPTSPVTILRITELPDLSELLTASLAEGHRLIERTIDDFNSGLIRFNRPGEALFIAREGEARVVGICGLNVDPCANDPAVGRVRHLYVLPTHRRRGVARALLDRVLDAARGRFDTLHLRTHNPAADQLYRCAGFMPAPDIATATHVLRLHPNRRCARD